MQFNIPAEHKNASGVYIIRNTVNDKVYVGSTRVFWKRYKRHLSTLRAGVHHSQRLQRHYAKHGADCLAFNLLELTEDTPEALCGAENIYITSFDAADRRRGFNNMPASLPSRHSPESKARISKAQKGRGDVRSSAGRERARLAMIGRIHSPEQKAKERERLSHPNIVARRIAALKAKGPHNKSSEAERQRICDGCKSPFLVDWPKQVRQYCSRACWHQFSRKEPPNKLPEAERWRDCQYCGVRFFARPSERTKTCSKDCGYALRRATTLQKHAENVTD